MAGIMGSKKKLSINHSFFTVIDSSKQPNAQKAPKNFKKPNGVVGLRILAALNDDVHYHHTQDSIFLNRSRSAVAAIYCKASSDPVPILSNQNSIPNKNSSISMEEMELCEEYTCVISHLGENLIKKREYFEADFLGNKDERVSDSSVNCGGETDSFLIADFLSSCFLCKKRLHGLDIFMYRGEKAFCSVECRDSQMTIDEQTDKYKSGLRNTIEYSVSPCSGTLQFFAGVAAA